MSSKCTPFVLDPATIGTASLTLAKRDKKLARLMRVVGPCDLVVGRQGDHLLALVRSIVFQQLSGKAASTIFARLLAALPESTGPHDAAAWLNLPDETLRTAGLSRQKIGYLRDLCERVVAGRLAMLSFESMSDDDVITSIVQVRGFGTWSAQMYLLFHLGRSDVWPAEDLGIRKALMVFDRLAALPRPKEIEARAERWRPYRSLASWYLWRILDTKLEDVGW